MEDALALTPAIEAFDAVAARFDARFGAWRSVAAQRRAVRRALARAFPRGAHVLEIGGGTGEDARWLAARGRVVQLTDGSPSMVRIAREKLRSQRGPTPQVVAAEALEQWAAERESAGEARFDGVFSNFAALNCVDDLEGCARGLARLLRPGAPALLVLFGTMCPGEVVVQLARGDARAALRRRARGAVSARLGGRAFDVRYHRGGDLAAAMGPWFRLRRRIGVGVLVPPSAAEPWISRHPALVRTLEQIDRVLERPLAPLGDHVMYWFERTGSESQGSESHRQGVRALGLRPRGLTPANPNRSDPRQVRSGGWGVHELGILLPSERGRFHPSLPTSYPLGS
ncbi:MAG: class I SAM-dependent methyltransferase [Gemmatimonadetes bacterium]|nr:class I SAM-dependent methyltransferase [Gemmatimonadota bacterium]